MRASFNPNLVRLRLQIYNPNLRELIIRFNPNLVRLRLSWPRENLSRRHPRFNPNLVRLRHRFWDIFVSDQLRFQSQLGAIKTYVVDEYTICIIDVSIPTWCD